MKLNKGFLVIFFSLALSGCAAAQPTEPVQTGENIRLTPYYTATFTPTVTPTPEGLPTSTPLPTATPTPRVYKVQANDTMIGIANYFGLTLAELQAANPGVQPALLSIGTELVIPVTETATPAAAAPAPVSYSLNLPDTARVSSLTGGYHCYALVVNEEDFALENLTVELTLTDPAGGEPLSRVVELPLHQLAAGARMPFYTYFNPPVFANAQASATILTVTDARDGNGKILPLVIEGVEVKITADGAAAAVSGTARLESEGAASGSYTLVGVAYDADGRVVGLRRITGETGWGENTDLEIKLTVYSTGGNIDRVEVFGEAQ